MRQNIWNKKIPTLLGLFLITLSIGITTFLVKTGGLFSIKASPSQVPKNVRISNITDNSFTVSYATDDSITGALNYGDTVSLGQSGLDDRDQQSGNITNYNIHNITVRNLNPNTKYYFTIITGKDTYMNGNSPFEVATGQTLNLQPLNQNPLSGKILLPTGDPPNEAIVYVTINGSEVISTLTKSDGTFILPLNTLRNDSFSAYFTIEKSSIIKLLTLGNGLRSDVTLSLEQISPVPTITLSSNYDFSTTNAPVASSSGTETFPSFESSKTSSSTGPSISTPAKDQEFTDQQPKFKGTALPNQNIQIIIHSDQQIQTSIKSDANGNWSYRPSSQLSPGTHTITILAKDTSGIVKTITQSFVVYASGNQIVGDQGSPTPGQASPTPTFTPTPTQAVVASASPVLSVTDTPTPTETSTVLLSPPLTTALPPTGNPVLSIAGILGILLFVIGFGLLYLSRGSLFL